MNISKILAVLAATVGFGQAAQATESFYLPVQCHDSYMKYGQNSEDLTKKHGQPIFCDRAIISHLDNGGVFVQIFDQNGILTPLGFVGYEGTSMSGKLISLPLSRIFLPRHLQGPSGIVDGIEGTCLFDQHIAESFACSAMIDFGNSRMVYYINARIMGKPEPVG